MMFNNNIKIHPSILCADFGSLAGDIQMLTESGSDYFHMDVMDGDFVPNFGLGTDIFHTIRKYSDVPLDVHLMIREPSRHVKLFRKLGAEIITIHPEADKQSAATLGYIKSLGAVPGIALNPGTSIESVKELLPICGHVLVMTVNPGFYGQPFLDFTINKIETLGRLAGEYGFSLCVDGHINPEKIRQLHPLGVTGFVIGTALFQGDPREMIREIKEGAH